MSSTLKKGKKIPALAYILLHYLVSFHLTFKHPRDIYLTYIFNTSIEISKKKGG